MKVKSFRQKITKTIKELGRNKIVTYSQNKIGQDRHLCKKQKKRIKEKLDFSKR